MTGMEGGREVLMRDHAKASSLAATGMMILVPLSITSEHQNPIMPDAGLSRASQ